MYENQAVDQRFELASNADNGATLTAEDNATALTAEDNATALTAEDNATALTAEDNGTAHCPRHLRAGNTNTTSNTTAATPTPVEGGVRPMKTWRQLLCYL